MKVADILVRIDPLDTRDTLLKAIACFRAADSDIIPIVDHTDGRYVGALMIGQILKAIGEGRSIADPLEFHVDPRVTRLRLNDDLAALAANASDAGAAQTGLSRPSAYDAHHIG